MLELPTVTLVCIDCEHHGLALAALEQSLLRARFGEVLFCTDRALPIEELRVVPIPAVKTAAERLAFIAHGLAAHLRTPHALLIQWDAFAVNPAAWDAAFLEYDWVAPLASEPAIHESGNEGIALFSTRLLGALASRDFGGQERAGTMADAVIAADASLRAAPRALRERFAFADGPPAGQPFGFQGLYNMWMFLQPQDLAALLEMATPDVLGANDMVSLAINLRDLGRHDESRAVLAAILRAHPDHALGRSLLAATGGSRPAAEASPAGAPVRVVGRNDPCPCGSGRKYKQCHGQLGTQPGGAPDFVPTGGIAVLFARARQEFERDRLADAEQIYRQILEQRPDDAVATEYLGIIATRARRFDEAERLLRRALELDPSPEFHNNLGLLWHSQMDYEPAIAAYRRALEVDPAYAPAHNNLGLAYQESGRLDAAIDSFRSATALAPDFAEAHWNLGLALVLDGQYEEGLREHEWRRKVATQQAWWAKRSRFPEWAGEPLAGKRILVLAEQGIGDIIHFVRYASLLAARGATVIVEAPPELIDLIRTVPGVSEVAPRDGPYPPCDVQVPAMSLPFRFGTRPDSIPAPARFITADPQRIARWAPLLGPRTKPRIGIAWAGNPEHPRDRARSMPLAAFAPLLALDDYEWLSLQKGPATAQIALLSAALRPRDMGKDSHTFADLAGLVEQLDLVIAVDTSAIHVAGALGKPGLLLLDTNHDWRWPRTGTDSRWYPSVRIARQVRRAEWDGAVRDAAAQLPHLLGEEAGVVDEETSK